jgi:hypothetical protein
MAAKPKKLIAVPGEMPDAELPEPASVVETPAPVAAAPSPLVVKAVSGATKMSYAQAQAADAAGELPRRVLTEQGWYVPQAARKVE